MNREIVTLQKWLDKRELDLLAEDEKEKASKEKKNGNSSFFLKNQKELVEGYTFCLEKIAS